MAGRPAGAHAAGCQVAVTISLRPLSETCSARYHRSDKGRAAKAAARNSPEYKAWRKEYESRPDVAERLAAQKRARRSKPEAKAQAAEYERLRRARCVKARLYHRVSVSVSAALMGRKAGRSWQTLVGYGVEELRIHLERQFCRRMSWKNFGAWHIDHIQPLSSFSFTEASDPEFRAAWALTNLRPLWRLENQRKGARRTVLL